VGHYISTHMAGIQLRLLLGPQSLM